MCHYIIVFINFGSFGKLMYINSVSVSKSSLFYQLCIRIWQPTPRTETLKHGYKQRKRAEVYESSWDVDERTGWNSELHEISTVVTKNSLDVETFWIWRGEEFRSGFGKIYKGILNSLKISETLATWRNREFPQQRLRMAAGQFLSLTVAPKIKNLLKRCWISAA